jgi:hypothetical protein
MTGKFFPAEGNAFAAREKTTPLLYFRRLNALFR